MALDALRGVAQGIAGRAFKKVAGNIRSGLLGTDKGGSDGSDPNLLNTFGTKFQTTQLNFPLDVTAGPEVGNHGHYMIFTVKTSGDVKLTAAEIQKIEAEESGEVIKKIMKEGGNVPSKNVMSGLDAGLQAAVDQKKADDEKKARTQINQIAKKLADQKQTVKTLRKATKRTDTVISMYMPPSVQVQYGANYTDTEIGAAANIAGQAFQQFQNNNSAMDVLNKSLKKLAPELGDGMIRMALGAADMIPGLQGMQEVIDMQRGYVKAPQMELAFKGIPKRNFSYTFTMIPKSEEEAKVVQRIVKAFKVNMLPTRTHGTSVRRLNIPNTFDIEYYYNGALNTNLHKIGECVLDNMQVTYGGDKYKAYEGGVPVVTNITLSFKELDLITREKAEGEGF